MTARSKKDESANYGIVGNVSANVVAVGTRARAVSKQTSTFARDDFEVALRELREQISQLGISGTSLAEIGADLQALKTLGEQRQPRPERADSLLQGLLEKLKVVGIVVQAVTPLAGAIRAVAASFGLPVPF